MTQPHNSDGTNAKVALVQRQMATSRSVRVIICVKLSSELCKLTFLSTDQTLRESLNKRFFRKWKISCLLGSLGYSLSLKEVNSTWKPMFLLTEWSGTCTPARTVSSFTRERKREKDRNADKNRERKYSGPNKKRDFPN